LPEGVKGGQQIDADVFSDFKTGKNYLYWGNGYMAGAELNEDMISLKPNTTKILTPDKHYNEGTYVIYRNGVSIILCGRKTIPEALIMQCITGYQIRR
jgi:arabinoxylan arabinofuranohydrolase